MADKSLLRLATTGSVDDGKSTLIGRLLYETRSVFEDQLAAVERTSRRRGAAQADLSLLLDGLAAEREQGITIDVAYRSFETAHRRFIIADCPGHEQYTRNMVTGASTAECAVVLIDARLGVQTQSRRHGFLVSLLRIPHLCVAVNKMDLVDFRQDVYEAIAAEYRDYSARLDIHDITFIPVSALAGDNVVHKSGRMAWYEGPTLLYYLESLHVSADHNLVDFRFPVQCVLRPNADFRGFAGRIVSGTIRPGEEVAVLPSGRTSCVAAVITYGGAQPEAFAPQSVALTLTDEIDISRGDMIVRRNNLPQAGSRFEAMLCWTDADALVPGRQYLLRHTTRTVKAVVSRINYRIDVNTLHRQQAATLGLNDIGRVSITTAQPVFYDPYAANHATGSFILIDAHTNATAAAGMIRGPSRTIEEVSPQAQVRHAASELHWSGWNISREAREQAAGHQAAVLWFTGLSASGKTTIARELERRLFAAGCRTMLLDGDCLRHGLCADLGFSDQDRSENIRRAAEAAQLFVENGAITLCTFISPFRTDRDFARTLAPAGRFVEVFVRCSLDECKRRDPKGLYAKALAGQITSFTGVDSAYEEPLNPELVLDTEQAGVDRCVEQTLSYLRGRGILLSH
jgi:bifunctional enzyme CysN/CysC